MGERCGVCVWFETKGKTLRRAPCTKEFRGRRSFPYPVDENGWCGHFKLSNGNKGKDHAGNQARP